MVARRTLCSSQWQRTRIHFALRSPLLPSFLVVLFSFRAANSILETKAKQIKTRENVAAERGHRPVCHVARSRCTRRRKSAGTAVRDGQFAGIAVHTSYRQFSSALAKGTLGSVVAHHLCLARIAVTAGRWQSVDEVVALLPRLSKINYVSLFFLNSSAHITTAAKKYFVHFLFICIKAKGCSDNGSGGYTATAINITNSWCETWTEIKE